MGARVSIKFKNNTETSPVLFSHWGGEEFVTEAKEYVEELKKEIGEDINGSTPLARLEPSIVMVDFIRHLTKDFDRVTNDLYLTRTTDEGDDSDYGHYEIEL